MAIPDGKSRKKKAIYSAVQGLFITVEIYLTSLTVFACVSRSTRAAVAIDHVRAATAILTWL